MTKRAPGLAVLTTVWYASSLVSLCLAVTRDQGIPDAKAYVGHIFRFKIPDNAFEGKVRQYQATEAGEDGLPAWLQFDASRLTFEGVPSLQNSGQLYICIKAIGESSAKDVFSIDVTDDADITGFCPLGKAESVANIIIDATLSDLKPNEKFHILSSVADHFNLPESKFKLVALRRDESSFDASAIKAGPGNALQRNFEGVQIQFKVGCDGQIAPDFEQAINALEKSAANGEVTDWVGHLVVGWHVSSGIVFIQPTREKRNVPPFQATPVPKIHITKWPTFTERYDESETKEAKPDVRIVPTMTSPRYYERTAYGHKHRHHHGLEPPRRVHIFASTAPSPTHHYRPPPTSKYEPRGTPLPTPILYPERPTTTTIVPTRVYDIDGTISTTPEQPVLTEDVLSRWFVVTSDVATLDILPTRSVPTIEPTKVMSPAPNFKPTVQSRTKKLSLVAGKAWSYTIPIDTFLDMEDGNTRDLKLMFMSSERTAISSSSWIQFDPENQIIYALPLSDNVGKYEYILEAMDSEGATTFDRIELHVWQHPETTQLTHSFTMTVRYNKWQYPVGIDWQLEVLTRISRLFNDTDNSKLSVLSVIMDPVRFTWTNDTLAMDTCPLETIEKMHEIISEPDRHPTKDMKRLMSPEFRVQDIGVKYISSCKDIVTTPPPPLNFAPQLKNPIKRINVTVGDIIKYRIPENTFYDFEDGSTRHLRLTLLTSDNVLPPKSYWVQFDSRSQEIYGLASETEIGRHDFLLNAVDSDDRAIPDSFVIYVSRLSRRMKPPVEFSINLDYDFDEFMSDTSKKTLVASKVSRLYGDPDPRYMLISNITRGSVVYAWSNKTLGNDYCPTNKIDELVKYIINEDGTLSTNLIQIMEPEFRVINAHAVPTGVCLGGVPPTFMPITTTTPAPSILPEDIEPTLKTSTDDDIYITTIVPAIVIAIMLVIAAIVAYFLYWKKRKGKVTLDDKDFIGSGVPVVFASELEEQRSDPGKAPAIMKDEKPPLSTDYLLSPFRRGAAAVRDSAPISGARTRDGPPMRDRAYAPGLYKPPQSSLDMKGTRPKSTQAYRHGGYIPP